MWLNLNSAPRYRHRGFNWGRAHRSGKNPHQVSELKEITVDVSVVIPIHNERENIPLLYRQLQPTLDQLDRSWEIVLVDDGSTDGSFEQLQRLAENDQRVKVVLFRRNFGQTAAMQAGPR